MNRGDGSGTIQYSSEQDQVVGVPTLVQVYRAYRRPDLQFLPEVRSVACLPNRNPPRDLRDLLVLRPQGQGELFRRGFRACLRSGQGSRGEYRSDE